MKYFLLTKSSNLLFIEEEYKTDEVVPNKNQVRYNKNETNSKLVKCSDGCWYIKNGNNMIKLKSRPINNMSIAELTENGGNFLGNINDKWFLETNHGNSNDNC